jgi:hypothetical protein
MVDLGGVGYRMVLTEGNYESATEHVRRRPVETDLVCWDSSGITECLEPLNITPRSLSLAGSVYVSIDASTCVDANTSAVLSTKGNCSLHKR